VWLRWGLVPSWSPDGKKGHINARSETAAKSPAFRSAFKRRRCLVLADGFNEWKGQAKKKQPYLFEFKDRRVFAFAGLWDRWHNGGEVHETCCILTTDANPAVATVHERMPVILTRKAYDKWLDPELQDAAKLEGLLQPYAGKDLKVRPVSTVVNNPRHEGPECVEPPASVS
jgi:putative SOS response-associated peptidase YedK